MVGFLYALFVLLCFFLIFIILLQKSKSSLGLSGTIGSSASLVFGGSGGQDLFQKITWFCVTAFMAGSLVLAILKNRSVHTSKYLTALQEAAAAQEETAAPLPTAPETAPDSTQNPA